MDLKLRGKGVLNSKSKSQENNPDFHVTCNIQCRPGQDCQKLRTQCFKVGQGKAKSKYLEMKLKLKLALVKADWKALQ